MFLDYYNLAEQPFGITPDPRFLYLNRMYREALASLWYGVKEGRGFMALVAQPGMGKTTLLFQLLQRLRTESARTVFLFQTCCSSLDLIRYLLQDMGILPAQDLASMHQQLNDALVREARAGRRFIFVIDEAQNLSASVLETVRLLSDFETPQGKLLQIILAGQPQLIRTLVQPEMLQLRQRISVTTALAPLSPEEVAQYVNHRLRVAGYQGDTLFTGKALEVISRESQGIPRNINNLCFGALSAGLALRLKKIDNKIVEEVAADQNLKVWQARIDNHAAASQKPVGASAIPITKNPFCFSTWVSRQVRRVAYAAAMAGLLMLAGTSVQSRKPEPASHVLAAKSVTVASGPYRKGQPSEKVPAAANGKHELRLPAALPIAGAVVARRGDNLRQICLRHLNNYSTSIVQELQALNPELSDPNRIEVGQRIRLPARVGPTPRPPERSTEERVAALGK